MKKKIAVHYYSDPIGELILGSYEGAICLCDWRYRRMREGIDRRIQEGLAAEYQQSNNQLLSSLKEELTAYFSGEHQVFTLPILLVGTPFQKSVWQEVRTVPYGETLSYRELSRRLDNEGATRAVAAANGANALAIVVPCHRIIGSRGELTGYAGGLQVKRKLLNLEGAGSPKNQPSLF